MIWLDMFRRTLGMTAGAAEAVCSSALLVDDFVGWSNNTNSLDQWASDDGSMMSVALSGGALSYVPTQDSYLYESLPCFDADASGYAALSFTIAGPADAYMTLEIQTRPACSVETYSSEWHVITGVTRDARRVTVPLATFRESNLNAITGFAWATFSEVDSPWEIGDVQLVCNGNLPATVRSASVPSSPKPATTASAQTASPLSSSPAAFSASPDCSQLLIDDWQSQSRLTFLNYNAMLQPTSDDETMESITVADNRVTLTPANDESYFYSKTSCVDTEARYGGISMRINAPANTTFGIQLASPEACGGEDAVFAYQTTSELGWIFDGTEKLYDIQFSRFDSIDLSKVSTVFFGSFSGVATFGPMSFYCGSEVSEYVPSSASEPTAPTSTVPAPTGTAAVLVVDSFASQTANDLGFWHGGDDGLSLDWSSESLTIKSGDPDYAFYTQLSETCNDLTTYDQSYLHIAYTGSNKFSIALQQHNLQCDDSIAPYPETWDSLEAARYATASDIYIPKSHFSLNRSRVIGLALKGFYTDEPLILSRIEIVPSVPSGFSVPAKLPSGNLVFSCTRPNSFAFAIDDGDPVFAQEVMDIIRSEDIKVTFFTVGAPLRDLSTNLSTMYQDMISQGHQLALHSYTHPKMEGLADYEAMDWEYNQGIAATSEAFNGYHTPYFRPPFGNEGARMRQRLAVATGTDDPYIVNWSVDVEDWLWAQSDTPEKQLEAFERDLAKGGNLVVMHYLYPSTVSYLQDFIRMAKATGKQLMRVDQCMMDPNAPPLSAP